MARQRGFLATISAIARESARAQRKAELERQRQAREIEKQYELRTKALLKQKKEAERLEREAETAILQLAKKADKAAKEQAKAAEAAAKQAAKDAQARYLFELAQSVSDQNAQLAEQIDDLRCVLEHTLTVNDAISFDSLRKVIHLAPFLPPDELTQPTPAPHKDIFLADIKKPSGIRGMLGLSRNTYHKAITEAETAYENAQRNYEEKEATRIAQLTNLRTEHEAKQRLALAEVQQQNQEVDNLASAYQTGDSQAVIAYNAMVLERSEYPEGFPQEFRLAYIPESKELVIEYELPTDIVIPTIAEYKFIKSKETIEEVLRKTSEIKELYQDIVAAIALRTIHEVFEADQQEHLQVVTLNGFVIKVDPATGQDVRPCLISLRTTRERFLTLNLARIDKRACLRNLGAQVSSRPSEMQAVKPVIEFDMVDHRFVEQSDILSDLESRPNLMELNPFEFENLVSNLFGLMGLDTKLTRSSRDGGVDCVAFDTRPILGGKVVIQAKRYSNTVGVSAVRDLFGTMMNEGANKGILVTTSGYGPDAYDFAKDKPIELIDGGGLLYLLEQHGIKGRIVLLNES